MDIAIWSNFRGVGITFNTLKITERHPLSSAASFMDYYKVEIKDSFNPLTGYQHIPNNPPLKEQLFHYMDKKEVGGDLSEDLTRESLIAISYRLPDKDISPGPGLPKTLNNEDAADIVNSDGGSEKYRSKLISIAYTQSTDTKGVPVSPGKKVQP